jgi:hypothetical protein
VVGFPSAGRDSTVVPTSAPSTTETHLHADHSYLFSEHDPLTPNASDRELRAPSAQKRNTQIIGCRAFVQFWKHTNRPSHFCPAVVHAPGTLTLGTPCASYAQRARLCVPMCRFVLLLPPNSLSVNETPDRTESLVQHGFSANPLSTMQSAPCVAAQWRLLFSQRRFFSMRGLPLYVAC